MEEDAARDESLAVFLMPLGSLATVLPFRSLQRLARTHRVSTGRKTNSLGLIADEASLDVDVMRIVLSVTDVNQLLLWKLTSTWYINFVSDELDASLNGMLKRYGLRAGPMRDCMRNLGAVIIGLAALAFFDREHYFDVTVLDISVPYSAFEGMVSATSRTSRTER